MMKKLLITGIAVAAFFHLQAQQNQNDTLRQELKEAVVTSSKFELADKEDGRSVTVINQEQIEQMEGLTLAEIMTQLSSMYFDGAFTNYGTNQSYYLRGGRNGNILVLIDGVPVKDPTDITSSFDFRHLSPELVEKIEIVKGGLSTLYGSDAVAGVINIHTKKPEEGTFNPSAEVSYGSYQTINAAGTVAGNVRGIRYLGGVNFLTSEGASAALDTFTNTPLIDPAFNDSVRSPFDRDAFQRINGLVKAGYDFNDRFSIDFSAQMDQYDAEIDNGEFFDDRNREYSSRQYLFTLLPKFNYNKGSLSLRLAYNTVTRHDFNDSTEYVQLPVFSYLNGFTDSRYTGTFFHAALENKYQLSDQTFLLAGTSFEQSAFDSEITAYSDFMDPVPGVPAGLEITHPDTTNFYMIDPYLTFLIRSKSGLNLNTGLRAHFHSVYGQFLTYLFNPSYYFRVNEDLDMELFASASSAFKSPSLYMLYSIYGNENLLPEESVSYEAGAATHFTDASLELTYFKRNETNKIIFITAYENGGEVEFSGVEFNANWRISEAGRLNFFYSTITSSDSSALFRIPDEQYGLSFNYRIGERAAAQATFSHFGKRQYFDYNLFDVAELEPYDLLNVYGSYQVLENLSLFGSVQNLLGEEFVSISGYGIRGRTFTVGIKYRP